MIYYKAFSQDNKFTTQLNYIFNWFSRMATKHYQGVLTSCLPVNQFETLLVRDGCGLSVGVREEVECEWSL